MVSFACQGALVDARNRMVSHSAPGYVRQLDQGGTVGGSSLVVPDDDYFAYCDRQWPETPRLGYLQTAPQASEMSDGSVYLLNSQVITAEGKWEAWFLAPWHPGASRYRSFWDLMQAEYDLFECNDS